MTSSPTPAVLPDARARTRAVSERLVAEMRRVARQDGWALAVHGSMSRDLDLIAVPWTDQATDETAFVEAMRASMARTLGGIALIGAGEDGRTPGVKAKPHGRRSWTIHSTSEQLVETEAGAHPYIDLCVLDFRVGAAFDSDWAGDWQGDTLSERARSMAAIRVAATATPPASDAAVPAAKDAAEIKKIVRWIDQAIERAKKHGTTEGIWLFASQWRTVRSVLAAAPKVASDAAQAEIERLRGLLVDPGSPPWEDARRVLVAELRKAGFDKRAERVAEAQPELIPSDITLNLMAHTKVASDTGAITPEWCLRMAELEAGQEIGAGALDHPLRTKCELPPAGRVCIRTPGHDGPCAAVASDTGAGFSEQAWEEAVRETDRHCYELDITNADHIVLWLEHQLNGHVGPLAYIACRILDAHEAALATPIDATGAATGGGENKVTDAHLNATTPGGDLLEQAARDAHEQGYKEGFEQGTLSALKPAGDGGEA